MHKNTKSLMTTGLLVIGLATINPAILLAEENGPEAELTMTAYSQYVWRGFAFSEDSAVVQPSISIAHRGFDINIWGNLDTNETGLNTANWNETDMTISYNGTAESIGYGTGWIYYNVDGAPDTSELYVSLSLDTLLAPELTFYYDIDSSPGWYATLAVSHSLALTEDLALELGAQAGYLDNDASYSELHDALLSASMTFKVSEYISVTPEFYYSFALSSPAESLISATSVDGNDNHLFGGISTAIAF